MAASNELIQESGDWRDDQIALLSESLADMQLALEDRGWLRLTESGPFEMNRRTLGSIVANCRTYFARHPLINRAVTLPAQYVWGQGINISGRSPKVNDVIQAFLDHEDNRAELTSHGARILKDHELTLTGNLFLTYFVDPTYGFVRVRSIPFEEIEAIHTHPDDRRRPLWYRRVWTPRNGMGAFGQPRVEYWRDWQAPADAPFPADATPYGGAPTLGAGVVQHVRVGGQDNDRWGLPEIYQAIDWARGYQNFLTDGANLFRSLSRFAYKQTVAGNQQKIDATKEAISRRPELASEGANVNKAIAGSTALVAPGNDIAAVGKSGASISLEDGRRLLLMVCAAVGLPETFFGDVSVGTLATAHSLDRPTELKFRDRQSLWADVLVGLLRFVVVQAVTAERGPLKALREDYDNPYTGETEIRLGVDPDENVAEDAEPEPVDMGADVTFPPILEHDVAATVSAVVEAVTLGGSALNDTLITPQIAAAQILNALGVDQVDELMDQIFPTDEAGNPIERPDQKARREAEETAAKAALAAAQAAKPAGTAPAPGETVPAAESAMDALTEAIREIREYMEWERGERDRAA